MLNEIIEAIKNNEIRAYIQPQFDTVTGKMVSGEALARWIKPDGSIVPPMDFVPVLEETDAICELDWHIAGESARIIREMGEAAVPIAVNFSRRHIYEPDFIDKLKDILRKYDVPESLFEVEITESALVDEADHILEWVESIHEMGIRVAIDDFGSGLSSLQFVKDIPIDIIKVDRSLLSGNCENEKERIVLESIFYFTDRLRLETVAEGVETGEQLSFLKTCGCNKIQGFLYSRPLPEESFLKLLTSGTREQMDMGDILSLQTPANATSLLLSAIFKHYPLIIFANLSRNTYYMMAYENFTSTSCPSTGSFDELIMHGAASMHVEDREEFSTTFSRTHLLNEYASGSEKVSLITRQLGNDGLYRRVATTDYFVKSPSSDDVLVISLNINLDQ